MSLTAYRKKRVFKKTPEPPASKPKGRNGPLTFVVQKHEASHLHYDFRLELDGVLKSWAIPKGPSMNPDDKRLAMMVEDHPLDYAHFEGIIPKGNYGAGTVMVWDQGVYGSHDFVDRKMTEPILLEQLEKGHITFVLLGEKLNGEFTLVRAPRMEDNAWLLIKAGDEYASKTDVLYKDHSVVTGRSMKEISNESITKKHFWYGKPKQIDLGHASKEMMPHDINPMLAETREDSFDNPHWIFEIKWDGYRAIAEIESGKVRLYSRNHVSYNDKFIPIVESLRKFPGTAILDGEIVVLDENGKSSFQQLQQYPESSGELVYYAFDILHFDGHKLTEIPLIRRKEILRELLPPLPHIRYGDYVAETGKSFFAIAKKLHLEGIVGKKAESRYSPGDRSEDWVKIKTHKTQEAIICGFTKPRGGREHFGALILGIYKRGKLHCIGHTGGGFNKENLAFVYNKLKLLVQDICPFDSTPETNAPVTWVIPKITCEITFKEWTKDGLARLPIFLRLHEDIEEDSKSNTSLKEESTQVLIDNQPVILTHLSKIFWPKEHYTKADVVFYYSEISSIILPYLKDRPQSLLRFPDGIKGDGFFQKNTSNLTASWLERVTVQSEEKKTEYLLCQNKAHLIYIINLGCIDFNPWNSRIGFLDNPDYLILDLDPEKVSYEHVIEVALAARNLLEGLDISSVCKTSGKRGLHIYIPLDAQYSYDQVRQFSQLLCLELQRKLPNLISLKRDPNQRQGKVYLDYLRNGHGQTTASVYSIRAWPHATVSTPLLWKEVNKRLDPEKYTMKTLLKRVEKHGDLFTDVLGKGIQIKKILKKLNIKYTSVSTKY